MFYDKLVELCREKGISPSKACEDMGLSNATATGWKKSKSVPQNKTLQIIAAYFGVSVQDLIGNKKRSPSVKMTSKAN
jgi:transcriptional regulator with XRE-family HTH domain